MVRDETIRLGDRAFVGMRDDPAGLLPEGYVALAENYFLDNRRYRPRPGTVRAGAALPPPVQALIQWESRADGSSHTMAVAAGKLYEYDWAGGAWVEVVMGAADPELDAAVDVSWAEFHNRLVLTDGINTPFSWDGTAFDLLTNAPVATGVTVYYSKLFFFGLPAEPTTFMWSEEGMPNEGYLGPKPGGGVYDNVWEFGQTDLGPVVRLVGTNEALVVMKEDSIAAVRGPVEESFVTTGQREGISDSYGLRAVDGVIVVGGDVYLIVDDGPKVIAGGTGQPADVSESRVEETWRLLQPEALGDIKVAYDGRRNHILWFVPRFEVDHLDWVIAQALGEARDPQAREEGISFFTGWRVTQAQAVEDTDGEQWVMFADDTGQVYLYGAGDVWADDGQPITRRLASRDYGADSPDVWKLVDKATVSVEILLETQGMVLVVVADGQPQEPLPLAPENRAALWPIPWGSAWNAPAAMTEILGLLAEGLRVRWRLEQVTDTEPPAVLGVTLLASHTGTLEY